MKWRCGVEFFRLVIWNGLMLLLRCFEIGFICCALLRSCGWVFFREELWIWMWFVIL